MARDYVNTLKSGYISPYDAILPGGLRPGNLIITTTSCMAISAQFEEEVLDSTKMDSNTRLENKVFNPGVYGMYLGMVRTPSRKYVKLLIDEQPYIMTNGNFDLLTEEKL